MEQLAPLMNGDNNEGGGADEFLDRQPSLSDGSLSDDENNGSDSSFSRGSASTASPQPRKKKIKVEESPNNLGAFSSVAGDPNMLALGQMGFPSSYNQRFSLTVGSGLPLAGQPMLGMPGFQNMSHLNHLYGLSPGGMPLAAKYASNANAGDATPEKHDDGSDGSKPKRKPGTTPLMFAGMPAARAPTGHVVGSYHQGPVMQVVSMDGTQHTVQQPVAMMQQMQPMQQPAQNVTVPLQKPKKWIRWR